MTIETLGEAWTAGWGIEARCAQGGQDGLNRFRECLWRISMDMPTLLATRGRDFPVALLASRLRCPQCGSRKVAVLFHTPAITKVRSVGA